MKDYERKRALLEDMKPYQSGGFISKGQLKKYLGVGYEKLEAFTAPLGYMTNGRSKRFLASEVAQHILDTEYVRPTI